ncbi:UNKNOWN [Stylonychia lemnae]|uniref:Transmembrane protein n=1 Tax=Stylonychia lemnae TaxID=5949 RepID=A0A078A618_STYLE|nr:UNKNOWN [Stylonychia lemnae]|eukprot:CDW76199.1 UNKNOWN [Stylonychia lemnae]
MGGAIYAENAQSVKIVNSTFSQNKALIEQNSLLQIANQGTGGAIYYTCNSQQLNCKMKFEGFNVFKDNFAEVKGGALFWDQLEPEFIKDDLLFLNNQAKLYGNDIACYSQNLKYITLQEYQNQMIEIGLYSNDDFQLRMLDIQNKVISHRQLQEINFQRSGDRIPIIYLALVDKYGQIQSLYSPILEGLMTYDMIGGVSIIQNIQISGTPGKCIKCEQSFSLVKMTQPGSCQICPTEKAICQGGAKIGPLPGFWRISNKSENFLLCLNEYSCLGMIPPLNDPLGECLQGYQGILCADCQRGYSRDGDYKCSLCPNRGLNILRLIVIFIAAVNLIVLMIRSTLKGAQDMNNVLIGYKIMASLVILLFLAHPSLVTFSFNAFKCKEVDGEERVCFVALPSIIVWGLGIPFFALSILIKMRKKLENLDVKQKYGFLYRGYKKQGSVYLSEPFQKLFFAFILLSNLFFFIYWTLKMYDEGRAKFRDNLTKIYLAIC